MAADAVLLDLDGTNSDSLPWYSRCVGREQTAAVASAEEKLRAGYSIATLLRAAGGRRRFSDWCRDQAGELVLYPGAAETLAQLRRRRRQLGAVTNLPEWVAVPMLDAVRLADVFTSVVTYVRPPKPHPRSRSKKERKAR